MSSEAHQGESRGFAGFVALAAIEPEKLAEPTDKTGGEPGAEADKRVAEPARFKWERSSSEEREPDNEPVLPRAIEARQKSKSSHEGPTHSNVKRNVFIVICLLVVGVALKINSSDMALRSVTPAPYSVPSAPASPETRQRPSAPSNVAPPISALVETETAPAKGDRTRRLNADNIRWCLFQDRRVEYLRVKVAGSESAVDSNNFNNIVNDYNDRCGAFQYRETDMARARSDLASKENELRDQSDRIWASWPHQPLPPPVTDPVRSEKLVSRNNSPTSLPPGPAVEASSGQRTNESDVLDLLRVEDAKRVQQRLITLGFMVGPADGIWTSRSRSALREFKSANSLARDDLLDAPTQAAIFAANAIKGSGISAKGNRVAGPREPEGKYAPPPGTSLNPLNLADAIALQKRLSQLGFFMGKPNGIWGLASRAALRDFKTMDNLAADDKWDADTELALNADRATRASETFIGGWGEDLTDCGPTQLGGARLRINIRQAEIEDVVCKFGAITREGNGWRVAADCSKPGKKWNSDVKIEVSANRLTWSSNGETSAYLRCK